MAGHSHSANIAHRKGLVDAKRAKLFTKLCRAIYVAARTGGGDPAANMRLRYAIDKARSFSVPKDNIERAIQKGTGEGVDADSFETVLYEGYGPAGVAVATGSGVRPRASHTPATVASARAPQTITDGRSERRGFSFAAPLAIASTCERK